MAWLKSDTYLWEVQKKLMYKHKMGVDESLNAMYPLSWYVNTGRASSQFLTAMYSVKPYVMARLLAKYYNNGSHDDCINAIKKKLDKVLV